jgi:hypothetical protein
MDRPTRKAVADSLIAAAERLESGPSTVMDIVDAIHSGDPTAITASSLGRVWQHVQDLKTQSFVIISASRAAYSRQENLERTKKLQQEIRDLGFGYVRLIGHWLECQAPVSYEDCPKDQLVDVTEPSMFVPRMSLSEGQRLARKFEQDGFVYGGPETDGAVRTVASNGRLLENLGTKLTTQVIGQGFSSLYDDETRRFAFIGIGVDKPMDAMVASSY